MATLPIAGPVATVILKYAWRRNNIRILLGHGRPRAATACPAPALAHRCHQRHDRSWPLDRGRRARGKRAITTAGNGLSAYAAEWIFPMPPLPLARPLCESSVWAAAVRLFD